MRSGKLRHRVTLQTQVETQNSFGEQETLSWQDYATVWGAVEPLQGREFFTAMQVNAETTVRIRIRYMTGVTSRMRVSFDSRIYNIKSIIDPDERNRELQLMCSEGISQG